MTTSPQILHRWPTLAGLATAGLTVYDLASGTELAPVLAASAVIYLGAAALGTPRATWPVFFATFALIMIVNIFAEDFDATWAVLGAGVLMLVYGLLRGALHPRYGLPLQTLALLGFGAVATLALFVNPVLGAYLVAFGLIGHAAWDLHHHRTDRVVVRSLAEFCIALDLTLALAIIILTTWG